MTGGITPVDNAFELIGLHQCAALMRFIFVETFAGKAVFVLGFLLSLKRALKGTGFKEVVIYCAIFFACLFLFVLPATAVTIHASAMETQGYSRITTEDILRKAGLEQVTADPVLVVAARMMSAFANGAVSVLDRLQAHGAAFLKSPFVTAKLWLLARESVSAGIQDPALKERTAAFYQDHYFPALRALQDESETAGHGVWPGSESVTFLYSPEGAETWRGLEDALYVSINREGIFDALARDYYDGAALKDASVRALLGVEEQRSGESLSVLSFTGQEGLSRQAQDSESADMMDQAGRLALVGFPWVYGLCLWGLWAAFPFMLVFLFLTADIAVLAGFLKCFFAVKLLPLAWAMIDRVSVLVFDVQHALGGGRTYLWDMPMVGMVVLAGMALSALAFGFGIGQLNRKGRV